VILTPASEEEAADLVREARGARRRLELRGGGTRSGLGRPVEAEAVLSSSALVGITLHEPAELVIAARAGTPVREVEAALDAHGQRLPVEPMDHRALYSTAGEPTVGGLVAANASGPRRVQAGAIRDHLIGVRLVNGRGEAIKSGGRVMKNVTGLDLVKLSCGAHGTLGFLTEVTFKVLPKPEAAATLAWSGLDDARAVAALTKAMASPFDVSGAAHIPLGPGREEASTLLRLEGHAETVRGRTERLATLLAEFGRPKRLADEGSPWPALRDGGIVAADAEAAVWRISVAPTQGPELVARLRPLLRDHAYDWGGGLVWAATAPDGDAGAADIRAALGGLGGHATLLRAPVALRRHIEVFEPLTPALRALTVGIKASFDPDGILNPGRMYAGI
jgi:glycolate oxidase FAD binding subunit